ncbi:hypothetical protein BCR32DRAFT_219676 [Anaeromyces robustus]|uniref:Phosphatases II n=1 Tax=Anaeromyces robustus TaxID=1754192 RepID=A0A1Y1X9X0_9FUNG|nr:hypothetical protein BCR32DRAFT_219676 [Anaeromyces robustus]|eukprot:ORX82144.1 hypothetical protein BCR32DRAFT_219676 [Anaeromyces robustus]
MDGVDLPFLIPPLPYGHVEDNVYRGGYPKLRNLRFLKRLRLKTVVSLTPDPVEYEAFKEFCKEQNIEYIHIRVEKPKDSLPLTYAKVAQIIQIILDINKLPIYIHCLDGSVITGVIFMCLRKLQLWDSSIIHIEYRRYTRDDDISSEAIEFLEKYNGEILLPEKIPHWLWNGQIPFKKHPTMKIRLPDSTESETSSENVNNQSQNNNDTPIKEKTNNITNQKYQNIANNNNDNINDVSISQHNVQEIENQNISHSKYNIHEAMTEEFTEAIRKKIDEKIIALRKSGKYNTNNEEYATRNHNNKSPSSRNNEYEKTRKTSNGQRYFGVNVNRNDDIKEGYNTNNTNSEYESNDDLYDSYYSGTNISDDEYSDNDDNSEYNDYNDNDDDKEDENDDSYSNFGVEDKSSKSYDISEINYQKMSMTLKALNLEGLNTHYK